MRYFSYDFNNFFQQSYSKGRLKTLRCRIWFLKQQKKWLRFVRNKKKNKTKDFKKLTNSLNNC